jgi:hypothetical protein
MTIAARIDGDLRVTGALQVDGTTPTVKRTSIEQTADAIFAVPLDSLRVHDALATNLPGTAADDDLALVGGTFGSASPKVSSGDVKAAGCTRYARFQFQLPAEYDAGQTVTLRASAGMTTTPADGSATLDFEVYKSDREAGIGSDLCGTAAQSINSTAWADKSFTITPTGLTAGDVLDVRMTITVVDTATGTAVIADVGAIEMLIDIRA